jgi:carbon-monoxide dehydrogenase medium subunit
VKPVPFDYVAPRSVDEALTLLVEGGEDATVIAGGQSLVPMLALRLTRPSVLVDVTRIAELQGISVADGSVRVGAAATQTALARSGEASTACPLLGQAIRHIGHPAIRNVGTVGGSVAHADPAAELPAAAVALEARMHLRSAAGERVVPAGEFFTSFLTTARRPDELLVAVSFPATPADRAGTTFVEFSRRHGDFALVGVACCLTLGAGGEVTGCRIALSGVGTTPVRAHGAEAAVAGRPLTAEVMADAADALAKEIDPPSDLHGTAAYRRHLAGTLVRRALTDAAAAARSV